MIALVLFSEQVVRMYRCLDGQEKKKNKKTAVSVFCILFFSLKLYEHYYGVAVPTVCFHSVGMEGINLNFC